MSYDMHVYAQQALGVDALRALLSTAGLAVDDDTDATDATALSVTRGARGRYSFTLGLPEAVEAEDVPGEVAAVLLSPSFVYELLVEGSSATETPHAVRFARRLARASAGVVLDQQTGQVWAQGGLRRAPAVARGTTDIVEFRWYLRPALAGAPAARAWLDLAQRHVPEALPRRFGPYEPLSMRLDVEGPDAFVEGAAAEGISFGFKASPPCLEGGAALGAGWPGLRSHSLSVHRTALADPRWRAPLQRLFTDFAAATEAVYASAEVERGLDWSGRSLAYGPGAEHARFLAPRGRWMGLTPYPVWWSWFGPDYVPHVIDHLPAEQTVRHGESRFHARADEPADRDQLAAALTPLAPAPRRRGGWSWPFSRADISPREGAWLPPELLLTLDDAGPHALAPQTVPAVFIPAGLRAVG